MNSLSTMSAFIGDEPDGRHTPLASADLTDSGSRGGEVRCDR